jgi:hypothetical protein
MDHFSLVVMLAMLPVAVGTPGLFGNLLATTTGSQPNSGREPIARLQSIGAFATGLQLKV